MPLHSEVQNHTGLSGDEDNPDAILTPVQFRVPNESCGVPGVKNHNDNNIFL